MNGRLKAKEGTSLEVPSFVFEKGREKVQKRQLESCRYMFINLLL